jgi:hypothetical protein
MDPMQDVVDLKSAARDIQNGRRRAACRFKKEGVGEGGAYGGLDVVEGDGAGDGGVVVDGPADGALERVVVLDCGEAVVAEEDAF